MSVYAAMAGRAWGSDGLVSDDSSGWGSDSDFDELSQRLSQACSAGGGSQSASRRPSPRARQPAHSARTPHRRPRMQVTTLTSTMLITLSIIPRDPQQAGSARWRARTARDRAGRWRQCHRCAVGRVPFPTRKLESRAFTPAPCAQLLRPFRPARRTRRC